MMTNITFSEVSIKLHSESEATTCAFMHSFLKNKDKYTPFLRNFFKKQHLTWQSKFKDVMFSTNCGNHIAIKYSPYSDHWITYCTKYNATANKFYYKNLKICKISNKPQQKLGVALICGNLLAFQFWLLCLSCCYNSFCRKDWCSKQWQDWVV